MLLNSLAYRAVHAQSHFCISFFFFSSRRRHTRCSRDWSSDVCSSDWGGEQGAGVCRSTAPRSLLPAPIRFPPMSFPLSRRRFLVGTAGAVAAAALGDGFLIEPVSIDVTRHDVPIPGLPHELDGFRIACITDLHLHSGIHRAARATLEQLARDRPHLVALTGDICNRRSDLGDLVAFAGHARGTVATAATLGNWEHDAGIDRATGEQAI